MSAFKDISSAAAAALGSASVRARPTPTDLDARIAPALDFMAKLPVDSYLIGGSLRDTVNGVAIRDFDIYVGPDFRPDMIKEMGDGYDYTIEANGMEYPGQIGWGTCNFDRKISQVLTVDRRESPQMMGFVRFVRSAIPEPLPIQIIVLKKMFATPDEAARSVDFGICQIVYNLKTGLHCTPEFFSDCISRTFTFFPEGRSNNDRLRSIDRFDRLRADKYQGYKSVGLDQVIKD